MENNDILNHDSHSFNELSEEKSFTEEEAFNSEKIELLKKKSDILTERLAEKIACFERLTNDIQTLQNSYSKLVDQFNQISANNSLNFNYDFIGDFDLPEFVNSTEINFKDAEKEITIKYDILVKKVSEKYEKLKELEKKIFKRQEKPDQKDSFSQRDYDNIIESKNLKISLLSSEISEFKKNNERYKQEIISCNEKELISKLKIREMEAEICDLENKRIEIQLKNDTLNSELNIGSRQLENSINEINIMRLDLAEIENSFGELEEKYAGTKNILDKLEKEYQMLLEKYQVSEINFKNISEENQNNKNQMENLTNEITQLKAECDKNINEKNENISLNVEFRESLEDLKRSNEKINDKLKKSESEFEQLYKKNNELEVLRKNLELRIIDLEKINNSLTNHLHQESELVEELKKKSTITEN